MKYSTLVILLSFLISVTLAASGCTGVQPTDTMTPSETTVPETPTVQPTVTPSHSVDEMVAFVRDAVAFANEQGKEAALEVFSDPNGSFTRGDLYIYAYDFDGTTLAHPINQEKIGVNRLNETDVVGNLYIRDLRDVAENGSGFVYFYYIDPAQNLTVQPKLGYVERVDETWWLGSGIYGVEAPATA
ncbi:cache domain-containing protein [Methanofollis tationis]|uniref:Cache domain-containing protein n=1 Tax=Methanofollis tationis TaxID=81417 RepID=A0A7K4HQ27_9EURY|nr:cache domain-containing protein [Methanofollis tationis]NVO67272.1 cache domain-containing protein [Methanofollis tationis]